MLWLPLIWSAIKVGVETFGLRYHIDFDPNLLVHMDEPGIPPTEMLLIGNGPLSPEQRAIIRNTVPSQVFRFNGMSNLHPGEPVGRLFARLSDNNTRPRAFWGIAPPPSVTGVVEALFVPSAAAIRTRFMCNRLNEALEVILLQGRPDDAQFYTRYYGIRVREEACEHDCSRPELNGGYWSSGFLGLLHVLQRWPERRVHVFGMNWAKHPQAQHPALVEKFLIQKLVKSGDVVIHRTPSAEYHQATNGYVLGFRCGEWSPWWFPFCYFSPHWVGGFIPMPPFFADPKGFQSLGKREITDSKNKAELVAASVRSQLAVRMNRQAQTDPGVVSLSEEKYVLQDDSLLPAVPGRKEKERITRLQVNLTQFDQEGYTIIDNVFSESFINELRKRVLALRNEGTQFGPRPLRAVDPGITIPDFMARSEFAFMHRLPSTPALKHVLNQVFRGADYRFCSHNDIGIDRIVGWHKDRLNDEYSHYQSLPLWASPQVDGGHLIVKALIYLQDHTHDDDAMTIVPGSFRDPVIRTELARTIHPRKGSVVIFEQRSTHRGRGVVKGLLSRLAQQDERVLVSLGYGLNNAYTTQFEHGTRARQANQCGRRCVSKDSQSTNEQLQTTPSRAKIRKVVRRGKPLPKSPTLQSAVSRRVHASHKSVQ
jgi:hypothetical protein